MSERHLSSQAKQNVEADADHCRQCEQREDEVRITPEWNTSATPAAVNAAITTVMFEGISARPVIAIPS